LRAVTLVRQMAATLSAVASAAFTMATGGGTHSAVQLAPGDRAPDFELPGSDGQVYRLGDLIGHGQTIVLAWFPKAFTGG